MARGQQGERLRRVGMLVNLDSPSTQERLKAFLLQLQKLGWTDGSNVQVDIRLGDSNSARVRSLATQLIAQKPDVVLAVGSLSVAVLQQLAPTLPIIFVMVVDPVGSGYVESMARPGVTTGFAMFEYSLSAGLNCLKRFHHKLRKLQCSETLPIPAALGSSPQSRPSRRYLGSTSARSTSAIPLQWSAS